MQHKRWLLLLCLTCATGCYRNPPPSQFPTAQSALTHLRESRRCVRAVRGEAGVDYLGSAGRVKTNLLYIAAEIERLRLDVFSPFGAILSTVTSNGELFTFWDARKRRFFYGPAKACSLARFTQVNVPPFVLVQLFRGEPPVLVHQPGAAELSWKSGQYVVTIRSKHDAYEEIAFEPRPADWLLPYAEQRLRLRRVRVVQQGILLYEAELGEYAPAPMSKPIFDPDGLAPDVPPSGPPCAAELPHRIRLEVSVEDHDLIIYNKEVSHNPPLLEGVFAQKSPPSARTERFYCSD